MGVPAGVAEAVAAYRRAGWLSSLGATDAEAAARAVAALTAEWGWPPAVGLDEALLLADRDRTWSDDVECDLAEGAGVYGEVVAGLCRLLGAPVDPGGVEEDWDNEAGGVILTVRALEPEPVLRVPVTAEVLHPAVVEEVNRVFGRRGLPARLWFVDTGGQRAVVTRATPEERDRLQAARPVRLDETPPSWWVQVAAPAAAGGAPGARPAPGYLPAAALRDLMLPRHGPPPPGGQRSVAYRIALPPVRGIVSRYGDCPPADGEAYLRWVEAVAATRAAAATETMTAAGAPAGAASGEPDRLEDLGRFVMEWFPEVAAPLYGRDWSYDLADLAAFVRAHASDGTLDGSIGPGPAGAEAYLAVRGSGHAAGLPLIYPSRRSTLEPLLDSLAHDLGFLVAERARSERPDLRWQLSRRRVAPGRAAAAEGVPVLEPEGQPEQVSALWTFPPIPAQTLLHRALVQPGTPRWDTEQRWLLWDCHQTLVTGRPSGRSAGRR